MVRSDILKKNLVTDLLSWSSKIDVAFPYYILPEELDQRDGFSDHAVCIYEGTRRPNILVDSTRVHDYVQQYVVLVYARTNRMKGDDSNFEVFFDEISDEVTLWLNSLTNSNRIYDVTNGGLRVPNRADNVTSFFQEKQEEISLGRHSYARIYFESIRKNDLT
jgi:hypothetical protein